MKKSNKGITLIALVITIIILLILSAITINAIWGENSLIARVKYSKRASDQAGREEQFQLDEAADIIDDNLEIETIELEEIETKYSGIKYYASLDGLFNTPNNETANHEEANAVIYKDENGIDNIVLFEDADLYSDLEEEDKLIINLNNHKLNFKEEACAYFSDDITIKNGEIEAIYAEIDNGKLELISVEGLYNSFYSYETASDVRIEHSNFKDSDFSFDYVISEKHRQSTETKNIYLNSVRLVNYDEYVYSNKSTSGISCGKYANTYMKDCYVEIASKNVTVNSVINNGTLKVDNSTIIADTTGTVDNSDKNTILAGYALINKGTLVYNSGYVYGVTHGIENALDGKLYIYGGTFEGTDHGGIYFANGVNGFAYVENAAINGVNYKGYFADNKDTFMSQNAPGGTWEAYKSAFYFRGSNSDSTENGGSVYIVDSTLSALGYQCFVLRNGGGGSKLYMSGTKILNTFASQNIRVDYANNKKIFFGNNCNIGLINTIYRGYTQSGVNEEIDIETAQSVGIINYEEKNYKNTKPNN